MRRRGGFTLVELVVALSVIAVLTSLAIPRIRRYRMEADVAKLIETATLIQTAYVAAGQPAHKMLMSDGTEASSAAEANVRGDREIPPLLSRYITKDAIKAVPGVILAFSATRGPDGPSSLMYSSVAGSYGRDVVNLFNRRYGRAHQGFRGTSIVPLEVK